MRCPHCGADLDETELRRHFARLGGLKGGRARSEAKSEAARRNGRLGGRPRKETKQ
jgi:hypothetical protein